MGAVGASSSRSPHSGADHSPRRSECPTWRPGLRTSGFETSPSWNLTHRGPFSGERRLFDFESVTMVPELSQVSVIGPQGEARAGSRLPTPGGSHESFPNSSFIRFRCLDAARWDFQGVGKDGTSLRSPPSKEVVSLVWVSCTPLRSRPTHRAGWVRPRHRGDRLGPSTWESSDSQGVPTHVSLPGPTVSDVPRLLLSPTNRLIEPRGSHTV